MTGHQHRYQSDEETAHYIKMWAERLKTGETKMPEENTTEVIDPTIYGRNLPEVYHEETISLDTSLAGMVRAFKDGFFPQYFEELDKLPFSEDEKENLYGMYFGVEPREIPRYFNKEILIHGCIIAEYGPFDPKDGGPVQPGYMQVLYLTDMKDENDRNIVLKAGSRGLGIHAIRLMKNVGWYLWRNLQTGELTPKTYIFSQEKPGASYRMLNAERMKLNGKAPK